MKTNSFLLAAGTALAMAFTFLACEEKGKKADAGGGEVKAAVEEGTDQAGNSNLQTFEFAFGFKVTVEKSEDFDDLKTYVNFKLERNNSLVYHDTSFSEYIFENKLFPIILQTGSNSFELLFEIEGRPGPNYSKRLFVSNDKLTGQDKLPGFEKEPTDINNDGIKEYEGYLGYSDGPAPPDESGILYTVYIPILYYSVTKTGLKLDSSLTKQQNEMMHGKFYGFGEASVPLLAYGDQTYRIEKIGSQTWMAENLNIKTGKSWCYDNDEANCKKYGRLYDWETAKKACPSGWHLPSSEEWEALVQAAGGENVAGKKLKSKTGWNNSGNGTDDFGFSAKPSGCRDNGKFSNASKNGNWWSTTENPFQEGTIIAQEIRYDSDNAEGLYDNMENGLSVRCVKD